MTRWTRWVRPLETLLKLEASVGPLQSVYRFILLTRARASSELTVLSETTPGIAIGDTVIVKKIKAVPAEKVIVAPLEAIPPIDERYLADAWKACR